MIYICHVLCGGQAEISELVVRDDELDVGDDEVASSEVAEVGERAGKLWGRGSG